MAEQIKVKHPNESCASPSAAFILPLLTQNVKHLISEIEQFQTFAQAYPCIVAQIDQEDIAALHYLGVEF
jgi:hypothetical protein